MHRVIPIGSVTAEAAITALCSYGRTVLRLRRFAPMCSAAAQAAMTADSKSAAITISRNLAKRHRKDLSIDEINTILKEAKEPYNLQKEIALKHRIPATLVGILLKEEAKWPDRLRAK